MSIKITYRTTKRVSCTLDEDTINEILAKHISESTMHHVKPSDINWPCMYEGSKVEASVVYEVAETPK